MKFFLLQFLLFTASVFSFVFSQNIPMPHALYSSELFYNRNVLFISIQPGQENVDLLASLYSRYGARINALYITNGENSQNDFTDESSLHHAVTLRSEATKVMRSVQGEATFFNFPDQRCVTTLEDIQKRWGSVPLISKLKEIITQRKPDVIVLFGDYDEGENSKRQQFVKEALLESCKQLQNDENRYKRSGWIVEKIYNENVKRTTITQIDNKKIFSLNSSSIADSAYLSRAVQGRFQKSIFTSRFIQLYPKPSREIAEITFTPFHYSLPKFQQQVTSLNRLFESFPSPLSANNRRTLQQRTTQMLAAIDSIIIQQPNITSKEQWKLYLLKNTLEKIKTQLMDITVHYHLSDSILTDRQVTFFRIDSIEHLPAGSNVEIFFPPLLKGWLSPDLRQSQTVLHYGRTYSFISPQKLPYTLPRTVYGLQQPSVQSFFDFVLFSKHQNPNETFNEYVSIPIDFAPRFSVEPVTSLVKIGKQSEAIIRLRNHSRDGVRDFLSIRDPFVESDTVQFRLNTKDEEKTDTLALHWNDTLANGTYRITLRIHNDSVGYFTGKKFNADIDTSISICLLSGASFSETENVLTNLGHRWVKISTPAQLIQSADHFTTIVIDYRTFYQIRFTEKEYTGLLEFIAHGGHLIVLSQDEIPWNASPFKRLFTLHSTNTISAESDVVIDSTAAIFNFPNRLTKSDFTGWNVRKSFNNITVIADSITIPLSSLSVHRTPLVLEKSIGIGRISYVNMDLYHQWINLHEGSYRLTANIIAHRSNYKH